MNRNAVLVVVVMVVVLGLGTVFSFMSGSSPSSRYTGASTSGAMTHSLSCAKQIAIAIAMYCADNDDVMPPHMDNQALVQRILDPYMKNRALWTSIRPGTSTNFVTNKEASLAPTAEIIDPTNAIILYEGTPWPDGRRVVAYADFHARILSDFDPKTGLDIKLTQKGEDFVAKARAGISSAESSHSARTNTLGMPGR